MKNFVAILSIGILFAGCGVIQPIRDLNPDQKAEMLFGLSAATTVAVLTEKYGPVERVIVARKLVALAVAAKKILSEGDLNSAALDLLWKRADPKFALYLMPAVAVLKSFYVVNLPGEKMGEENTKYVNAFLYGVWTGAYRVLEDSGES